MNRPSEISQLDLIINRQENILRLDVPMDNLMMMDILKVLNYLVDVECGTGLGEFLLVLENLVELAVRGVV